MAEYRRYSNYIDGSAVRKYEAAPEYRPDRRDREKEEREKKSKELVARNKARARKKVGIKSLIVVTFAALASLYLCVSYVMVYSDIEATGEEIASLERQIEKLSASNEIDYAEVDSSLDLDYVYKVATKKLGMVPASKNQVYKYDNKKSDRVIQYNNIPE